MEGNKMPHSAKSKKTIVYENLKRRIITNALKPGDPLSEGILSKELKISKTPVREALQQLEKKGLVENIPGKGAFVSRFSFQDIRELCEIRDILECEVIKRITLKGDLNLAEAEAIRDKFIASDANGGRTGKSYFNAGDQIHSFIFATYGNRKLIKEYQGLQEQIARITLHFFSQNRQERAAESFKEHLEIIDALISRDPVRAEKAMRTHIRKSLEYLKSVI
jgi:DNA-binding GntR family transcriptional regulator